MSPDCDIPSKGFLTSCSSGMATYFVSRHTGTREWARARGFHVDYWVEHLDTANVQSGDVVIGTLPLQLVAEVQEQGGRYLHLSIDFPAELRGRELSAEQMDHAGARLEEYRVLRFAPIDAVPRGEPEGSTGTKEDKDNDACRDRPTPR